MDIKEIRRQNLLLIISDVFAGRQVDLADRIHRGQAQITQWKSPENGIHEKSARMIEAAAGKPPGWMDVPHSSGHEPLTVQKNVVAPAYYALPRPSLRVALEALCEELARVEEPERRDSVAALLRSCAVAGGDTSYIEPILSVMRFKQSQPQNNKAA
jgi:hypothetical protein